MLWKTVVMQVKLRMVQHGTQCLTIFYNAAEVRCYQGQICIGFSDNYALSSEQEGIHGIDIVN